MRRRLVVWISTAVLGSSAMFAQQVVSARSGLIHYVEGKVLLGDQAVASKLGSFPDVKENGTLRTELGRAEVLLTPGVFLRVGENSSFRMITNRLIDTRLEFLSGSAVVEADDMLKDNAVTVVFRDATVRPTRNGLYRFDSNPPALRVFHGEAAVETPAGKLIVKEGKMLPFDGGLAAMKFDKENTDGLDRWSRRRAETVAMANISAARSLRSSGLSSSSWAWNPYYGMFTFIPARGVWSSPYGFRFWSPYEVYRVYERPVYASAPSWGGFDAGRGYSSVGATSSGYSGTIASSSSSAGSPAAASHAPSSAASSAGSAPASSGSSGSAGGSRR